MKKMTFDEYDALVDRLLENAYQCDDWWPTKVELKERIGTEINTYIPFLIWILETNGEPETAEEKESKKYIQKLLYDNLNLYSKDDK